jgi:TPR repeat protein
VINDEKDDTYRNYIEGLKKLYVDKDYNGATELFKKVEKAGVADGITMQAVCLADTNNSKGNAKKAFKILTKEAESNTAAKLYLAQMYQDGNGVERDAKKATELILAAAEAGNGYAQEKAGNMYFSGQGVTQDYVKAVEYYLLAEAQSKLTPASAGNLIKCYNMGISNLPDKNKTKERIEQLQKVVSTNNLVEMLKKL